MNTDSLYVVAPRHVIDARRILTQISILLAVFVAVSGVGRAQTVSEMVTTYLTDLAAERQQSVAQGVSPGKSEARTVKRDDFRGASSANPTFARSSDASTQGSRPGLHSLAPPAHLGNSPVSPELELHSAAAPRQSQSSMLSPSEIRGVVTDSAGAPVKGAEVSITEATTGTIRMVVTNETGTYSVTQIRPGKYTVRAALPDSKGKPASGVVLVGNESITFNLTMGVSSALAEKEAEAPNTPDTKTGGSFDARQIIDLPQRDRNVTGLAALQPGDGQMNGTRSDQQNIVLDGVNMNRQERGDSFQGALPVTPDSIQELTVLPIGTDATDGRGSGAEIQLVTRSGSNEFHGSAYESYRTAGMSSANFFTPLDSNGKRQSQQGVRHIPGFSVGGPAIKNKLFIFTNFERATDHSTTLSIRTVPTPQFLAGHVRYLRKDNTFGELTDGCGGMLEKWTLIPCDTWNKNLFGPSGLFERYRPYSTNTFRTTPSTADRGANILDYTFNNPLVQTSNVSITRLDYTPNSKHSFFFRGTFNDYASRTGGPFPGMASNGDNLDKSRGFSTHWNWLISPEITNGLTIGLTREARDATGGRVPTWTPNGMSSTYNSANPASQAISTWNLVDNFSWVRGAHNIQSGVNFRFIGNRINSQAAVRLPDYAGPAKETTLDAGFRRAFGDTEFARISNPQNVGNAVMAATGSVSTFSEDLQFDIKGAKLPSGSPFVRTLRLQEYEFYLQDVWKATPTLSLVYGINYGVQTTPYEKNGLEVNWIQNPGARYGAQKDTPLASSQMSPWQTELAGRANKRPGYYPADTNNWSPRLSFAWTAAGFVIRGGYSVLYDGFGRSLARRAAELGSIGLKTQFAVGAGTFGIDGTDRPRAPRLGALGWIGDGLPRASFPAAPDQASFALPVTGSGGTGAASTIGIDRNLRAPKSQLVTFAISKELPGGWVVESSYVGRFSRDLLGVADIASPVNLRDSKSGMTYYDAVKQLYETAEFNSVPVADIKSIAWFENVYAGAKSIAEKKLGRTFNSATQAFYAMLHQSLPPGPNSPVSLVDTIQNLESSGLGSILLQPQVQYFGLLTNLGKANYHSGQLATRKRFSNGFSTAFNYTFSKSLDTVSATEAAGGTLAIDPYHPELQYSLSDFDRRHRLSGSFVVELPFGKDAKGFTKAAIGGWEVSGIVLSASGRPWSFESSSRYNFGYAERVVPRMIAPINFQITKSTDVFMVGTSTEDRVSIAQKNFVSAYPGGPIVRNQARGPGFFNLDGSVTKNFSITERSRVRLRWEVFNVTNHPNFALPSSRDIDAADGNLGRITSTVANNERVMQFVFRFEW